MAATNRHFAPQLVEGKGISKTMGWPRRSLTVSRKGQVKLLLRAKNGLLCSIAKQSQGVSRDFFVTCRSFFLRQTDAMTLFIVTASRAKQSLGFQGIAPKWLKSL